MIISPRISRELQRLPKQDAKRIFKTLTRYPHVERKKLFYLNNEVSRVKCGKYRLLIRDQRGGAPELCYFGLRNDVYRRSRQVLC